MHKRFIQRIEDVRRLIEGSASASVSPSQLPRGVRFLLAVSGGMDSMCMADLFLQSSGASSFAIAHCNFSLRGEESDGDEALVREWAEANGVEIFFKRFDTVAYAGEKGISIEMAARDLRYEWFARLCADKGFSALSVAHNANDNAETLMLNLLRGTGLKGLHAMDVISRNSQMLIVRPLLECTRKQIEGYVLTHRVPYRHDSSNFESDYKRNRIRNDVFPVFEKINPSFIRTLNREIGYFSEAADIVGDWCRSHSDNIITTSHGRSVSIDLTRLLATPHWRYLLYYILEPYGFSSQVLSSLEDLLTSERTISGKRFDSPTHILLTGRTDLTVVPAGTQVTDNLLTRNIPSSDHGDEIMVVRGPGIYNFNGSGFTVELQEWKNDLPLKQPQGVLILDADKLKFPFVCRRWRQGDWLIPLGMRGKKKVSDLFTDLKYDILAKESAIIMVDTQTDGLAQQQHIAGLLGIRIDDAYKVTSSTRLAIKISKA